MNAISTKLAVPEIDALLGGVSPSSFDATRPVATRTHAEVRHPGALPEADVGLPRGAERLSLADALRERYPSSPVVVLFLSDHSDETLRAIGLREMERIDGPWAHRVIHLRPSATPASAEITPITRESLHPEAGHVVASRPPSARSLGLTQRQMDVLRLIVQGKPNKLICRELNLAEGTVKCHVSAILRALDVGTRTQAALKGARLGLGADRPQAG
ncbi:MAG: response regulator transcription factor [Burkholderiales bacterium]